MAKLQRWYGNEYVWNTWRRKLAGSPQSQSNEQTRAGPQWAFIRELSSFLSQPGHSSMAILLFLVSEGDQQRSGTFGDWITFQVLALPFLRPVNLSKKNNSLWALVSSCEVGIMMSWSWIVGWSMNRHRWRLLCCKVWATVPLQIGG